MMYRKCLAVLALMACALTEARADFLTGFDGLNKLGGYEGTFEYKAESDTKATLKIELTNKSPDKTGYLTAFVFNNPGGKISTASLVSSDTDFKLVGKAPFADGVSAGPFGNFDFGVSTGKDFEGGGAPSLGLAFGATGTFTFTFTGTGLDLLTNSSFFSELSVPPGAGEGVQAFVARFRGFEPEGSDKVPGELGEGGLDPAGVPEPSTLLLAALGIGCVGGRWVQRRRARSRATV